MHCPLLFLWEKKGTFISDEGYRKRILDSAEAFGRRKDQIEQTFVDGGHSLALFVPTKTAAAASTWIEGFWRGCLDEEHRRRADAPIDPENVPPALLKRAELVDAAIKDYYNGKLKL